jgi:ribonucleoside-diphosphate reductase beta chain
LGVRANEPGRDLEVQRLYEKAKQLGTWDPAAIDFTEDLEQWPRLAPDERDLLAHVAWLFFAGEEAVTRDLLPIAFLAGNQRRYDDELFVTAWLWEEGKHTDFFRRYLDEVIRGDGLVTAPEPGRRLYDVELPEAMSRLMTDSSPVAHARALTTYCLIVEGMLADTGQLVLEEALEPRNILPGLREGLVLVNRDESRHVAYGLHVLKRLIESDARVAPAVKQRVQELAPLVTGLADAVILRYESRPFGLSNVLGQPVQRLLSLLQRLGQAQPA